MSTKPQIELFLENESGTQQVAYPFVESDHVSLSNGMDIDTMIRQDVSMPTVAHEDLSFKVGVGDQDVSSAIVDSSVAEMTIKGKTYQNILPEPSTHVLTNNKEMFKVNEGLDPNVEIVDGVSKSAILSGQTLVNTLSTCINKPLTKTTHTGHIKFLKPLESGKEYTIIISISNAVASTDSKIINIRGNNVDGTYKGMYDGVFKITNGIQKVKFTPTDGFATCLVAISGNAPEGSTATIDYLMFIEGDHTNEDIPYFTGMQSVKMPVLTTTGSNMVNPTDIEVIGCNSYDVDSDGIINVVGDTTGYWARSYIRYTHHLKGNTTYYIYCDGDSTGTILAEEWVDNINKGGIRWSNFYKYTPEADVLYEVRIFLSADESPFTCSKIRIGIFETTTKPSSFEPYKSNILSTPEDLELRGIGNVKDELNLMNGELTQRVGEIVLDGSEELWNIHSYSNDNFLFIFTDIANKKTKNILCDKLPTWNGTAEDLRNQTQSYIWGNANKSVFVWLEKSKLSEATTQGFKDYLQSNPIILHYQLATESVKTVDLSSSGNWEKIVFNGSENWSVYPRSSSVNFVNTIAFQTNTIPNAISTENLQLFSESFRTTSHYGSDVEGIFMKGTMRLSIKKSRLMSQDVDGLKQYLQQNPLTVWYQTVVHQDSTQVKQPIFFKDGHIQLSSGADNSLIPTLDYQAKTSNSYVMDLMKTGTTYTMKASGVSGTATIGNAGAFTLNTNRTFTSPASQSLFDNKLLVIKGSATDLMIIEGDVTSKTIPYFKGIKSAFEGEDKIEVLSTGKNLFDINYFYKEFSKLTGRQVRLAKDSIIMEGVGNTKHDRVIGNIKLKPNTAYKMSCNIKTTGDSPFATYEVYYNDALNRSVYLTQNSQNGEFRRFTTESSGIIQVRLDCPSSNNVTEYSNIYIVEDDGGYEPHKSNNTKIPLLSPLRSLPNGTCDELIIDRMKKKATLIQRVYEIVLNDKHLGTGNNPDGNLTFMGRWYFDRLGIPRTVYNGTGGINANKMPIIPYGNNIWAGDSEGITIQDYQNQIIDIRVSKSKLSQPNHNGLLKWANDNPIIFQYELETPIITEVDLEGFPYIYKDGHIFLNGDIAPVTEIKYSINQQHQIEASNQDIIRHQKEIDYLYKLVGEYVRVDYKNTLLSLNLELK